MVCMHLAMLWASAPWELSKACLVSPCLPLPSQLALRTRLWSLGVLGDFCCPAPAGPLRPELGVWNLCQKRAADVVYFCCHGLENLLQGVVVCRDVGIGPGRARRGRGAVPGPRCRSASDAAVPPGLWGARPGEQEPLGVWAVGPGQLLG